MNGFKLDPRLVADCIQLGKFGFSHVLLMNNPLLPWFILVPETTETEMYALPEAELHQLNTEIRGLCDHLGSHFNPDKLNVAAIGNIVRQLHVHVVGRTEGDYCWPGVVWGSQWEQRYTPERITQIGRQLQDSLGEAFVASPRVVFYRP